MNRDSITAKLAYASDIVIYLAIWAAALIFGQRSLFWVTSLCLSGVAFVLWIMARKQLGSSFMIGVQATQLVTHGLYRYFKHPIYYFGWLAHLFAYLALQIWWLTVIWILVATSVQLSRLHRENLALEAEFGDAFRLHRRSTWV